MTFEEFQKKVKKRTALDKYWYYTICIAVIGLSLALLYYFITQPEKFKGPMIIFYLGSLALLFLGLSGFYFLPKRYRIVTIESDLPVSRKQEIIAKLILETGEISVVKPPQYLSFNLKRKWWQSHYVAQLFFDEHGFSFCLQGHDYDGGFLDFGETERKRKMLASRIKESL